MKNVYRVSAKQHRDIKST